MSNVPNTNTFSLFDVLDAVYSSHSAGNLSSAFTDSHSAYFDATYGSKTMSTKSLYGFRNYHVTTTTAPTIFTDRYVYSISASSAVLTARIRSYTSPITAYGICYSSTNTTPWLSDSVVAGTALTYISGGDATFSANITGLTQGTHYYARAYVTDSGGTSYGGAGFVNWAGIAELTSFSVEFMPSAYAVGMYLQGGHIAYIKVSGDAGYDPNIQHGTIMGSEAFTSGSWSAGMAYMSTYSQAGYSDWVLPNDVTGDLGGILTLFQSFPSMFPLISPGVYGGAFWTRTDMGGGNAYAYNYTSGYTPISFSEPKTLLLDGMPVRYF